MRASERHKARKERERARERERETREHNTKFKIGTKKNNNLVNYTILEEKQKDDVYSMKKKRNDEYTGTGDIFIFAISTIIHILYICIIHVSNIFFFSKRMCLRIANL